MVKGEGVFFQGDPHTGVWIIESGRVRTFYAGPSGREITLAYWSIGHFLGDPHTIARYETAFHSPDISDWRPARKSVV